MNIWSMHLPQPSMSVPGTVDQVGTRRKNGTTAGDVRWPGLADQQRVVWFGGDDGAIQVRRQRCSPRRRCVALGARLWVQRAVDSRQVLAATGEFRSQPTNSPTNERFR